MSKTLAVIFQDKRLAATLSGIILCGIVLLALVVTAGVLFI
jgi:hypothetical protein